MRVDQPTATAFRAQLASAGISHFRTGSVTLGLRSTLIEAGRTSGLYSRLLPGARSDPNRRVNSSPFGMPIYRSSRHSSARSR
jgi:hypothetical protein